MKQVELPQFVSIQFYPGYSYTVGTNTSSGCGRYVALARDGRAYVKYMNGEEWQLID